MILIAGGVSDPNILQLVETLSACGCPISTVLVGSDSHPSITWDMSEDTLHINDVPVHPFAVFLRHDVFSSLSQGTAASSHRALAWYSTIFGWCLAHSHIGLLNRHFAPQYANKPYILFQAQQAGLEIPDTWITNDTLSLEKLLEQNELIAKPVNGGDYCQDLNKIFNALPHIDGRAAGPAIVQTKLVAPDVRVYGICGDYYAYSIQGDALDYRTSDNISITPITTLPTYILSGLQCLMKNLKMDFGAADFKTCPTTGRLLFLEINSAPMFAAFDRVSENAISKRIAECLRSTFA